jgi:predicted phosphohydrolase
MTLLLWGSDLHLDRVDASARDAFLHRFREFGEIPCVLTGDIAVANDLTGVLESVAAAMAGAVYFVLGNHDHYGSSVAQVRDAVLALGERLPKVQWLPPAGVVMLDADTALVGVDGWADGGAGDALTTPLRMNDDRLIAEIAGAPSRRGKLAVKRALAEADAARLATLLDRATASARQIVIATHVPPFVESLPTSGALARVEWQPLLVSHATGEVLRRAAAAQPRHRFLVLAGHTHVATDVRIAPNLRCIVAAARYGAPALRVVDTASA